jgi:glycosyltransferase involved in cell wall biosynthesis
MRGIMRVVTRRAARILVPSAFTKQDLQQQYHLPADKLVVTHEAVGATYDQPEVFKTLTLPDRFIMYLGNMYPYKNIGRLIAAFAQTKARRDGTKLILAGRTPYFEDLLKAQAKQLGLADAVIFTGRVTDGEAATLYRQTALFVFPSLYEGFGLMGLEAMSLGTPVLSSNASCLPEIHDKAAEYFDPRDASDMARHIDDLLANPQRLEELRQAGHKRVKQFSWRKMARETLEVYEAALKH